MLRLIENPCALQIGVLGINFKTASLDLREKISREARALWAEKGISFHPATVVLSTCNRTEIYFAGDDLPCIHGHLLSLFRSTLDTSFEPYFYSYFGLDCFAHLCRVSSGLDSAIVAETEIQRQVKVAYEEASQSTFLPSSLHYVFQKALKVGKEVRHQLAGSFISPSLFTVIWRLSKEFLGELSSQKLLFVGYSDLNRQLISAFSRRDVKKITLCTRHPSRIARENVQLVGRGALKHWRSFNLIICASKADHYLISSPGEKGRLLFDLSVPRNVDPSIDGVSKLYNMEQINEVLQAHREKSADHFKQADLFVRSTVRRLAQIYRNKQISRPLSREEKFCDSLI